MKKHKKRHNEFEVDEFDMDELLAEDFYGTQTEEDEWEEVIERWDYSYNHFDDYDYYNYHYPWGDKWEDFTPCDHQCEFQQGGCCLIDYYSERIFRDILDEDNCKIGNYKTEEEYNKAKEVIALYNYYKQNPKKVEFMLKLIS